MQSIAKSLMVFLKEALKQGISPAQLKEDLTALRTFASVCACRYQLALCVSPVSYSSASAVYVYDVCIAHPAWTGGFHAFLVLPWNTVIVCLRSRAARACACVAIGAFACIRVHVPAFLHCTSRVCTCLFDCYELR